MVEIFLNIMETIGLACPLSSTAAAANNVKETSSAPGYTLTLPPSPYLSTKSITSLA
jgi:hypothetical protein